ncbi:MAG: holC [Gammaproteobacteria bacterium]|jgi:DNA polymerase-3 subunit chi|nr:holC [Gammaproteobacteria bacterium]
MSPRVDFYLLADEAVASKMTTACRLIEKAYQAGLKVYIHTDNIEQASRLDVMLWTFRDISFVPHALYESEMASCSPVTIGYAKEPAEQHDLLVNLTDQIPNFYQQFQRVIEIIPNHEAAKQLARAHYKSYKDAGCELHSHQLEK